MMDNIKLFSSILLMILGVILVVVSIISFYVNPKYMFWTVLALGIITFLVGGVLLFIKPKEKRKEKIEEKVEEEPVQAVEFMPIISIAEKEKVRKTVPKKE